MGQMMIPRLPQGNRTIALMLIAAMLLCIAIYARAGWRVVVDPWTTAQVTANAGAQKLIEDQHNERLDTISAKQKKIMQYTATMESIKELYRISMTNIRGFGEETAYYNEIFNVSAEILTTLPTVTKYIATHPVKNYILCLNEISDVAIETEGLIHDFIDIMNIKGIIDQANLWCSIVAMGGFHYDYIWDILNSDVKDEIAAQVIGKWTKG